MKNKSDAFTCQVDRLAKAPARIELLGDKAKRPESAQHVIEFPGGAIEVSRCSDGSYWAHIHVNRSWADGDMGGIRGALGRVESSRIGTANGVQSLPADSTIEQIAVRIVCS